MNEAAPTYTATPANLPPCDVLVAGGGIAGVYAALAAARRGANTVLVEQHAFVGGQGTAGGVHTFCGETRVVNHAWREMLARLGELGGIDRYRPNRDGRAFDTEALKFVLQEMLAEASVTLLLHTQLVDVERDGGRVQAAILFNKSGLSRLACAQVIDATGDADVVARGGFGFSKGGAVFLPGEQTQIDRSAGHLQLPMSLYFTLVDTGEPVQPHLPPGCPQWESDEDVPMTSISRNGNLVVIKMKVIGHDATDGASLSAAEQAGRRQMMGLIYYLQTKGYHGTRYDTYRLAWVAPHIGIREGRRVDSIYQMTVDDVMHGRHFEDAVAVGSYHVDYHWPTVVQRAGTGLTTQCPPYQIPLRAMRPKGSENVLVPGRCMGGEQMAMSSYRVMGICAQTGFAAGSAAALAVQSGQSLDRIDIAALQDGLRADGVRLDLAPYTNYLRRRRAVREHVFDKAEGFAQCHASTLVVMPNGDVVCAWFGGTREGADDVAIWAAIRHEEVWSEPFEVARHPGEPTWNPVLFLPDTARLFAEGVEARTGAPGEPPSPETAQPPKLLLYYRAGATIMGWRTYVLSSEDGGRTWSEPEPLPSGFLGPIKNKPIALRDGTWLAGSSVETADEWYCVIERSTDEGRTWTASGKISLPGHPKGLIQPTLWESAPGRVHALLRSRGVGRICRTDSSDGGITWSTPYVIDLPHNNSGIDLAPLVPSPGDPGYDDGAPVPLALVYNPVEEGRTPIALALSYDNGETWPDQLILEDAPGEYSYPAIVPTADGVALTYTHKRETVAFARVSLEEIKAGLSGSMGKHDGRQWLDALAQEARG